MADRINPPWWWKPWLYLYEPRCWWLRGRQYTRDLSAIADMELAEVSNG